PGVVACVAGAACLFGSFHALPGFAKRRRAGGVQAVFVSQDGIVRCPPSFPTRRSSDLPADDVAPTGRGTTDGVAAGTRNNVDAVPAIADRGLAGRIGADVVALD